MDKTVLDKIIERLSEMTDEQICEIADNATSNYTTIDELDIGDYEIVRPIE